MFYRHRQKVFLKGTFGFIFSLNNGTPISLKEISCREAPDLLHMQTLPATSMKPADGCQSQTLPSSKALSCLINIFWSLLNLRHIQRVFWTCVCNSLKICAQKYHPTHIRLRKRSCWHKGVVVTALRLDNHSRPGLSPPDVSSWNHAVQERIFSTSHLIQGQRSHLQE